MEQNPPIFNVPRVVIVMLGMFFVVHLLREFVSAQMDLEIVLTFAFIPQRYAALANGQGSFLPGGGLADFWSFFTYMFLHGNWAHLTLNSLWMLAFGSPLAWRLGATSFVVFSLVLAAAGAALHLVIYWGELVPVVGASAAISGYMAAVIRFAMSGPTIVPIGIRESHRYFSPAEPLSQVLSNPRVLIFIAVWVGVNFIFGVGIIDISGSGSQIAWEAHLGGFLAGLLLFPYFDPVGKEPRGP